MRNLLNRIEEGKKSTGNELDLDRLEKLTLIDTFNLEAVYHGALEVVKMTWLPKKALNKARKISYKLGEAMNYKKQARLEFDDLQDILLDERANLKKRIDQERADLGLPEA